MFAIAVLVCVGCSEEYDDAPLKNRVGDLENRVAKLEELCKQMNTNISSLQTIVKALQQNDYVTGIAPVTSNGTTIGYTISFTKSAPVTIYHGKDGHTPVIGVRQDTDGIYYWTLDGGWLLDNSGNKIKAEGRDGQNGSDGKDGENGADGKDGQNGSDGQPGAPGKDGKDGITPQLRIEEGYWHVSTDNGSTWTNLGKATGEDGKDGVNTSDSMFRSVTQDDENVYFTLASGETITLPKKQQLTITFAEGNELFFDVDQTITVNYTIVGGSDKNVVKAEMQNLDGSYTLRTTQTSATKGTIAITAKVPTANRVIVSVSDGKQTVMEAIAVGLKASFDGSVVTVETPGTLARLIADYDKTTITELTVIGNLNASDISTLGNLPNLAVLDMVNVNSEELPDSVFYQKTSLTDVKLPKTLKTIGRNVFYGCSNLTSINIPDSVTSIGDSAFSGCRGLTSITIPNGITTIEDGTLFYCSSLTNVTIPDSVTTIGKRAFMYCRSLTNITIGNSVTTIGEYIFDFCNKLTSIYCKAQTPPEMNDNFNYWSQCTLYVPMGCKEAYAAADKWKYAKEIIEMEF